MSNWVSASGERPPQKGDMTTFPGGPPTCLSRELPRRSARRAGASSKPCCCAPISADAAHDRRSGEYGAGARGRASLIPLQPIPLPSRAHTYPSIQGATGTEVRRTLQQGTGHQRSPSLRGFSSGLPWDQECARAMGLAQAGLAEELTPLGCELRMRVGATVTAAGCR